MSGTTSLFTPPAYLRDHLLRQCLAFFPCFGIDLMHLAFALGVGGGVASLKQVVVDLINPAGTGFAELVFCARN